MKCKMYSDVPIERADGTVEWIIRPCTATPMKGSKFCRWHHRDDFIGSLAGTWRRRADACDKEIQDAATSKGRKTLSTERVQHYEQAAITLRACAKELDAQRAMKPNDLAQAAPTTTSTDTTP